VVLDLHVDSGGEDRPKPGIDAKIRRRLDLTHAPRGFFLGGSDTAGGEMVELR
jgi:hypothetical protein